MFSIRGFHVVGVSLGQDALEKLHLPTTSPKHFCQLQDSIASAGCVIELRPKGILSVSIRSRVGTILPWTHGRRV